MKPAVTIVSPVYGRTTLLEKTVNSVIGQKFKNWELVLVDDGSSPSELEKIKQIAARDQRLLLEHRERNPKGGNTCRNIGLDKARANYVIFLDSDDLLLPHCLDQRLKAACSQTHPISVCAPTIEQNSEGKQVVGKQFSGNSGDCPLVRMLCGDYPWQTAGVMWLTEDARAINGWHEGMPRYQDWDFGVRMLLQNRNLVWLDKPDLVFIEHGGKRVSQKNREYAEDWLDPICHETAQTIVTNQKEKEDVVDAVSETVVNCLYLMGLDRNLGKAIKASRKFRTIKGLALPGRVELTILVIAAGLPRIRHLVPRFFSRLHKGRFYRAILKN